MPRLTSLLPLALAASEGLSVAALRGQSSGRVVAPEGCPGSVALNAKGDCIDAVSGDQVDGRCCAEIPACQAETMSAMQAFAAHFQAYQRVCEVTALGMGPHGRLELRNEANLCEAECLDHVAGLMPLPDVRALRERCAGAAPNEFQGLEKLAGAVLGIREIQAQCSCPVTHVLNAVETRLADYEIACKLEETGEWLSREDDGRLCVPECQASEALSRPLAEDAEAVLAAASCGGAERLERLGRLLPLARDLDSRWKACGQPPASPASPASPSSPSIALEDQTCPDPSMRNHECGYFGIQQPECEERGCCWDPSEPNANWCYSRTGTVQCEHKCPTEYFPRPKRSACMEYWSTDPDPAVRGRECERVGCCWQPLEHNSDEAWCFYTPCL